MAKLQWGLNVKMFQGEQLEPSLQTPAVPARQTLFKATETDMKF